MSERVAASNRINDYGRLLPSLFDAQAVQGWTSGMLQIVDALLAEQIAQEGRLLEILKSHNMKEERILYPSIDQVISEAERAELYQAMKEIPEERYRTCCGSERS